MACPHWDVPDLLCWDSLSQARGLLAPQEAPVLLRKVVVWHSCSLLQARGGHSNILSCDPRAVQLHSRSCLPCPPLPPRPGRWGLPVRSPFYRPPTFIHLSHFSMLSPSPSFHFCFLPASLHPFFFFLSPRLLRLRESSCSLCANTVFSTHACAPSLPKVAQR